MKLHPLFEKMQIAKGNEKIDLLNEIAVVYRKTDRFMSLDFSRKAYELSVENNYLPGKAFAKKNEGVCWFFIGNSDSTDGSNILTFCLSFSAKQKWRIKECSKKILFFILVQLCIFFSLAYVLFSFWDLEFGSWFLGLLCFKKCAN
jgi:hypothetical protein